MDTICRLGSFDNFPCHCVITRSSFFSHFHYCLLRIFIIFTVSLLHFSSRFKTINLLFFGGGIYLTCGGALHGSREPFVLYVWFSQIEVPGELDALSFHKLCVDMHLTGDKIWKKRFSGILSHDLYWENKRYKQSRFILHWSLSC